MNVSCERNTENTMLHSYFNGEIDCSEENTCDKEVFRSTIFQTFQFQPQQIIRVVTRAMRKKLNIFTLQAPMY